MKQYLELGAMIFGSHRVANQSLGEPLRRILHSHESAALLKEISSNQPCMYCTIKEPTPTAPIKKKFKGFSKSRLISSQDCDNRQHRLRGFLHHVALCLTHSRLGPHAQLATTDGYPISSPESFFIYKWHFPQSLNFVLYISYSTSNR